MNRTEEDTFDYNGSNNLIYNYLMIETIEINLVDKKQNVWYVKVTMLN